MAVTVERIINSELQDSKKVQLIKLYYSRMSTQTIGPLSFSIEDVMKTLHVSERSAYRVLEAGRQISIIRNWYGGSYVWI